MILVNPSYEIIHPISYNDVLERIVMAGLECTQLSGNMQKGIDYQERFVRDRKVQGHFSIFEHVYLSVRFVVNRKAMTQIVRHRLSSYSVESTRYCNYANSRFSGVSYIFPEWNWGKSDIIQGKYRGYDSEIKFEELYKNMEDCLGPTNPSQKYFCYWYNSCLSNELEYLSFVNDTKDLDTASELLNSAVKSSMIITKNIPMWWDFFNKRTGKEVYKGVSYLSCKLQKELKFMYPAIF